MSERYCERCGKLVLLLGGVWIAADQQAHPELCKVPNTPKGVFASKHKPLNRTVYVAEE